MDSSLRSKNAESTGNRQRVKISRRNFVKSIGVAAGSLLLGDGLAGEGFGQSKPGEPIETLEVVLPNSTPCIEGVRLIVEQWRKLGLDVRYTPMPSSALLPKIYNRDYRHLAYMVWPALPERYDPGFWLTEFYHSSNAKPGGRNWGDYINPRLDTVLDQQEQELDTEKRREAVLRAQAIAAEDHPIWYTVYPNLFSAYNKKRWDGWVNMIGAPPQSPNNLWNMVSITPKTAQKIFVWAQNIDLATRNPFTQAVAPTQGIVRFVYDRFFQISPDLKVVPWAAESWKWVDKTTLDIRIRKDMSFHDGKPVTPEDAAFSFDYFLKYNMPRYGLVTKNLKGVKLLETGDIRLYLKNPSASYVGSALVWAHILPKHIWEDVSRPMEFEDPKMIGSGPFALKDWKKGEAFLFTAHKTHFSKPKMDGFYYIIIPALQNQIGMLEKGDIDILGYEGLQYSQAKDLAKHPDLSYMTTEGIGFYELRPRVKVKPFDDLQFRKALHYAIPKREILKVAHEEQGVLGHNTPITPRNRIWHNDKIPYVEFNMNESKRMLEKAGYFRNPEGKLCYPGK